MKETVLMYDTTLRDGQQGERISFSVEDKIKTATELDKMGFHYIEGGWPGANAKDTEFFKKMKSVKLNNAKLVAFGSTMHKDSAVPSKDKVLRNLINAGTDVICIFGKTSDLHVRIMKNTLKRNLEMIEKSVKYLKSKKEEVIYDAEHFFDAYKENAKYAIKTVVAALKGGADWVVFCDTNGGCFHYEINKIIKEAVFLIETRIGRKFKFGIHAHNDMELAVANSIEAVRCGAGMAQGTINGYGERCGNANLVTIIPVLSLKKGIKTISENKIKELKNFSRMISDIVNVSPDKSQAFVGDSAFAHKGGIHGAAVVKNPKAYEHEKPELVGNKRKLPVTDQAGKSNLIQKAKELGIDVDDENFNAGRIVDAIKEMERQGYQFDEADGTLRLIFDQHLDQFDPIFEVESWQIVITKEKDSEPKSRANVTVLANGERRIRASEGVGPVHAFDQALREALSIFFPEIHDTSLVDYKVRVVNGVKKGIGATEKFVRTLIETKNHFSSWITIGVSQDVIAASAQAIEDGHHCSLLKKY